MQLSLVALLLERCVSCTAWPAFDVAAANTLSIFSIDQEAWQSQRTPGAGGEAGLEFSAVESYPQRSAKCKIHPRVHNSPESQMCNMQG